MKKVAIVGANGFVGKALSRASLKYDFDITEVTRDNYQENKDKEYDILINTAMPSRRFWALNNPVDDVNETIVKTAKLFYEWKYDKFIQISSISAEQQLDIPYGAHKRAAEVIVENSDKTLILRLGALYGEGLLKSALFDLIKKQHIYVDIQSEYNYINIDYVAKWIFDNAHQKGIVDIGARDTISLLQISKGIWDNPSYEGRYEKIFSENVAADMPSSQEVLEYVKAIKEG